MAATRFVHYLESPTCAHLLSAARAYARKAKDKTRRRTGTAIALGARSPDALIFPSALRALVLVRSKTTPGAIPQPSFALPELHFSPQWRTRARESTMSGAGRPSGAAVAAAATATDVLLHHPRQNYSRRLCSTFITTTFFLALGETSKEYPTIFAFKPAICGR